MDLRMSGLDTRRSTIIWSNVRFLAAAILTATKRDSARPEGPATPSSSTQDSAAIGSALSENHEKYGDQLLRVTLEVVDVFPRHKIQAVAATVANLANQGIQISPQIDVAGIRFL